MTGQTASGSSASTTLHTAATRADAGSWPPATRPARYGSMSAGVEREQARAELTGEPRAAWTEESAPYRERLLHGQRA